MSKETKPQAQPLIYPSTAFPAAVNAKLQEKIDEYNQRYMAAWKKSINK